ncbi:hypothetical protein BC936DRAFT_137366 [Jimgerdemannia flammicorona]|uniref:Uncharacterized protein n=2 Tax=Jimgerdemannia flammicorona TaxID=994334 RepID=A0A433Q962_9FUNG|nr:hypothetical protein BC936DRAFT_137366 [Jimgerdemannia flammicorona]RUS26330.1 hypothetical protein BC938DRAFT_470909 [Jimgerdemannia flammicorona]
MPRPTPPRPRRVIAVDLDETLATTLASLVQFHNATYGTHLKESDFFTHNYWEVWGGTPEESYTKIRRFYESRYFLHIQPINEGALETLKMLKKRKFTLVIITSRQQFVAEQTKKFVDRHFPGIFESIYFCNHDLSEAEKDTYIFKPKSAICHEIGAELLIDDSLEHSLESALTGINVLLFDLNGRYGWNKARKVGSCVNGDSLLPSNVRRVMSWKQISTLFPRPSSPLKHVYIPEENSEEGEDEYSDSVEIDVDSEGFADLEDVDAMDVKNEYSGLSVEQQAPTGSDGSGSGNDTQDEMLVDDDDLDDEDTDNETLRDLEWNDERAGQKPLFRHIDEPFNLSPSPLDTNPNHPSETMVLA